MTESNYRVIKTYKYNTWDTKCPVRIEEAMLVYDHKAKQFLVALLAHNVSDRVVASLYFDLECSDYNNELTEKVDDFAFYRINIPPKTTYSGAVPIVFKSRQTTTVELNLKKAVYDDDSFYVPEEDGEIVKIPHLTEIDNSVENYTLILKACDNIDFKPKYLYRETDSMWICSCSQPNPIEKESCLFCGGIRSWQKMHFDPEFLDKEAERKSAAPAVKIIEKPAEDKPAEAAAETPKEADEPEKKKSVFPKILIAVLIAAVVAAGGYAAYTYYLKDFIGYYNSVRLMNNGNYETAFKGFEALGEFKDSADKAKEARALLAERCSREGKYAEAIEIYKELEGYGDSGERLKETELKYADVLIKNNEYDSALEILSVHGEEEAALPLISAAKLGKANSLISNNSYDEALEILLTIPDYENSGELIKKCYYEKAVALAASGDYGNAAAVMANAGNYSDAEALAESYNQQVTDAKYLETYNKAVALERSRQYVAAYETYATLPGSYKDVAQRMANLIKPR